MKIEPLVLHASSTQEQQLRSYLKKDTKIKNEKIKENNVYKNFVGFNRNTETMANKSIRIKLESEKEADDQIT
jgi:hypothetical protein